MPSAPAVLTFAGGPATALLLCAHLYKSSVSNRTLNCFGTVTAEEARDVTVAAEVSVMTGETLGPLHGVPVSMKDLLFTQGVPTAGDVFHGRLLFLDGEVSLVKNLTDLNHVAFVGGAPLHPFHELFF